MAGRESRDREKGETKTSKKASELSAPEAAKVALEHIESLTAKKSLGVTSVEPSEEGWLVGVEILDQERIPSSSDLLALYETEIDLAGELLSYRRTQRYLRGRSSGGNGGA